MRAFSIIFLMIPFFTLSHAGDRYSWLRDGPIEKQRVISSNQRKVIRQAIPKATWKVSSKDTRMRTMTISNKKPATANQEQSKPAVEKAESIEKGSDKEEKKARVTQLKPAEVSPEQLNEYIAALEFELTKLNREYENIPVQVF